MAFQTFIANGRFTNFTNGLCRVTVLGENMTDHDVNIYSSIISVPETGITLPLDTILGRNREITDIYDATGAYAGSTSGNDQLVDKTQSMTFADDFVYLTDNAFDAANSKSIIYNLFSADKFTTNHDGAGLPEIVKVVGTNGNVKRGKLATVGNCAAGVSKLNHYWLLAADGLMVIPQASDDSGNSLYQENTRITAYNGFTLCVMMEFLTQFDCNNSQGYRFSYCSPSNIMWNEADDYNTLSADVMMLCDYRMIDRWFADGNTFGGDAGTKVASSNNRNYYEVNGTAVTTITGTADTNGIDIVPATGVTTFGATIQPTGTFVVNDIIRYSAVVATGTEYTTMVCTTGGVDDAAVWTAHSKKLVATGDNNATGAAIEDYTYKLYDFDFISADFRAYIA